MKEILELAKLALIRLDELEARVAALELAEARRKRRRVKPDQNRISSLDEEKKWATEPNLADLNEEGLRRIKKEQDAELLRRFEERKGPTPEELGDMKVIVREMMEHCPPEMP